MPPWITNQMATWQARIWLAQGNLEAASQWARDRALDLDVDPKTLYGMGFFALFDYILLARILIATGRLQEATPAFAAAARGGRKRGTNDKNDRDSAAPGTGSIRPGRTRTERCPRWNEPSPSPSRRALSGSLWMKARRWRVCSTRPLPAGSVPDYAGKLLAAFPELDAPPPNPNLCQPRPAPNPNLRSPTRNHRASERARAEVLELFAEGLTNQEIASRLYLALNTVKAHSRNIYGKLDVHSRTQAVVKARALGLLSST